MSIENRKAELTKRDKTEVMAILALKSSEGRTHAPVPSLIQARWGHLTKDKLIGLILDMEYPGYQSNIEVEEPPADEFVTFPVAEPEAVSV